ncbi:MAG: endonuclease [Bacteroidetes bacterium]|nr:endonuclease [Bacteroidota bacterium]
MAFPESIKVQALENSAFRCCICQDLAADVHHIIPKSKKGSNLLENAAPLCASCHDLFGDNPAKSKKIRQMRDYWWTIIKARTEFVVKTGNIEEHIYVEIDPNSRHLLKDKGIVFYHAILPKDTFEDAARVMFSSIYETQKKYPNQERYMYIDIDGHRNEKGAFDHDMYELQCYFNLNVILPYVTRIYSPLISVQNKFPQRNDIPESLEINDPKESKALTKDKLTFKKSNKY